MRRLRARPLLLPAVLVILSAVSILLYYSSLVLFLRTVQVNADDLVVFEIAASSPAPPLQTGAPSVVTLSPTTKQPSSSASPTTKKPSSASPTSASPTTKQPSSVSPTTTAEPTLTPATTAPSMPTAQPYYSRAPTAPTNPDPKFPLWHPPSPANRSVMSTYGDYEWVYPSIANKTEYAQSRYVASELETCQRGQFCCAVGIKSNSRTYSDPACGLNMPFQAEFQLIPPRPLFSLVDVLVAWRRANPKAKQFKLLMLGDSIAGQTFLAALCELARNSKVKRITDNSARRGEFGAVKEFITLRESHIQLVSSGGDDDEGFDFSLLLVKQYVGTTHVKSLEVILDDSDIILFFLGIHYENNGSHHMLLPTLDALAQALRAVTEKQPHRNQTLMWFGAPRQHFRFYADNDQVNGAFGDNPRTKYKFCGPVAHYPEWHTNFNGINGQAFNYMVNKLNVSASWFKWNVPTPALQSSSSTRPVPHLHFFPLVEMTAPFYTTKAGYNPYIRVRASDCTHSCWAPNFYESYWDALYLAVTAGQPPPPPREQQARFPAGTYHARRYRTGWNTTKEYSKLIARLVMLAQEEETAAAAASV